MTSAILPVFHIGANKAGSTTLQQALFARHPQVHSLGKPEPVADAQEAIAALLAACDRQDPSARMPDPPQIKQTRTQWGRARDATAAGCVPVFSREELIRYRYYGDPDPLRLPRMIADMAGPVRVVIVTRHQLKLIESLYIHKTNMSSMAAPDEWIARDPDQFAYGYRFHNIADAWAQVVGQENVGVFMFEDMVKDSAGFAQRLCAFIGIDGDIGAQLLTGRHENVRKSRRTQAYAKLRAGLGPGVALGRLLPTGIRRAWHNYLDAGPRARANLPIEWVRRMEDCYREDNRLLAQRFGLDLRKHDYPM